MGEIGCRRAVSPFSRRWIRHWRGLRSRGRRLSAPPLRQALSVCRRSRRLSSAGSSPVVAAVVDQAVGFGVPVQAAHGGDEVLLRAAAAAGGAADHGLGLGQPGPGGDLGGGYLGQRLRPPQVLGPFPVGAVGAAGALRHRRGHHRDVLGHRGHRHGVTGIGQQIRRIHPHPRQQQPRRIHLGPTHPTITHSHCGCSRSGRHGVREADRPK